LGQLADLLVTSQGHGAFELPTTSEAVQCMLAAMTAAPLRGFLVE